MPKAAQGLKSRKGKLNISTKVSKKDVSGKLSPFDYDTNQAYNGAQMIRNAINQMLNDPNASGFVIRGANGKPIGAISYSVANGGKDISINYLGSDQSARGVGSSLMKSVAKVAAKRGMGLTLESDFAAAKFYEKLGFSTKNGDVYTMSTARTKAFSAS